MDHVIQLPYMIVCLLQVVMTMDEVNFIQNLIYYVERAYRTPDFGMWERGTKENVGKRELHARYICVCVSEIGHDHVK